MKKIIKSLFLLILVVFIIKCDKVNAAYNDESNITYIANYNSNDTSATGGKSCTSLLGSVDDKHAPAYYLNVAFKVIKYVAIVILFGLSTIDMVGAVASHDEDVINKTVKKIGGRFLLCIIIFILPTIIEFLLKYMHESQISSCGIRGE